MPAVPPAVEKSIFTWESWNSMYRIFGWVGCRALSSKQDWLLIFGTHDLKNLCLRVCHYHDSVALSKPLFSCSHNVPTVANLSYTYPHNHKFSKSWLTNKKNMSQPHFKGNSPLTQELFKWIKFYSRYLLSFWNHNYCICNH